MAALASAGVDTLAPPHSSIALALPPPPKRRLLQLAVQPEPSQPTTGPDPSPPPPTAPAPSVEAQLAAILAMCPSPEDDADADEAARIDAAEAARIAGKLFRFMVTTSEELAQAQNELLKYKEEEAERERVIDVAPRMRVAIA